MRAPDFALLLLAACNLAPSGDAPRGDPAPLQTPARPEGDDHFSAGFERWRDWGRVGYDDVVVSTGYVGTR